MSTVVWYGKIRIMIRSDDHGSPHCHASGGGGEAKIYLSSFEVERSRGFTKKTLMAIIRVVMASNDELLAKWREYHEDQES